MELYLQSPSTSSWRDAQLSTGITIPFTTDNFIFAFTLLWIQYANNNNYSCHVTLYLYV